jgi:hypothetical protein
MLKISIALSKSVSAQPIDAAQISRGKQHDDDGARWDSLLFFVAFRHMPDVTDMTVEVVPEHAQKRAMFFYTSRR